MEIPPAILVTVLRGLEPAKRASPTPSAANPNCSISGVSKGNPNVLWSAYHPPPLPSTNHPFQAGMTTVTSHNPGLPPRTGDSCLVRKVSFLVPCFLLSRSLFPSLPVPCWYHSSFLTQYGHLASVQESEGAVNLQAVDGGQICIHTTQELKSRDSAHSSHRLALSLNRRGITETGRGRGQKTNLQRRNFPSMTPLIIRFLISKSSLMRHFCLLIGFSISMRTLLAQKIRGINCSRSPDLSPVSNFVCE